MKKLASGETTEEQLKVPVGHIIQTLKENDARPRREPRTYIRSPIRDPPPPPRKSVHERMADPPRATGAPQRRPRRKIDFSPEKDKGRL